MSTARLVGRRAVLQVAGVAADHGAPAECTSDGGGGATAGGVAAGVVLGDGPRALVTVVLDES